MNIYFGSAVLLSLLAVVSLQEVSRDYVPEVVYPRKSSRMRNRTLGTSREQSDKPANKTVTVEHDHHNLLQKRLEHIKENRRNRNQLIMVAPVEGHRIYTMDRYFVSPNGLQKVTAPATVKVESGKLGRPLVEEMKQQSSVQKDKLLTLVTLEPPLHSPRSQADAHRNKSGARHNISQGVRVSGQTDKIPVPASKIRFPAQSWQIPPNVNSKKDNKLYLKALHSSEGSVEIKSFETGKRRPPSDSSDRSLLLPDSSSRSSENLAAIQTIRPPYQVNARDRSPLRPVDAKPKATFAKTDAREPIPLPGQSNPVSYQSTSTSGSYQPSNTGRFQPLPVTGATSSSYPQNHFSSSYEDYRSVPSRQNINSPNSIEAIVPTNKVDRPASSLNPNQKLDLCCRKQGLSPSCQTMCNFDTFSDKSLVNAFLTNQCPGPQLGQAFDCATSKVDHSECCVRKNVHIFNNGQCLPFCRTHIPTPPNAFEYLACLQVFESIKGCYREHQFSNPNLYGD
uniref:DB domain-containing protein n=1 Tax=Steinernema glaseri TaxID=37863 RepID=A0A1I7Y4Y7_9BILA